MPPRPHFHQSGEQLRELFSGNRNNVAKLHELRGELTHRRTPKMRALLVEVEARLADLARGEPAAQAERPGPLSPGQGELFGPNTGDEPIWSDDEDSDEGTTVGRATNGTPAADGHSPKELPPDDRRRPSKFTLIQHLGVSGRPSKYTPPLARDLVLPVPKNASTAKRFSVALDALVAEMRREGTGSRSFILSDGAATKLGTDGFGYVFDFLEEADVFEDAQVEVIAGTRRCNGSVASILPGKIILSLDENLGPKIRVCVLKIDNTALLVALKQRLDEIDDKKLSINIPLADTAISTDDRDDGSVAMDCADLGDLDPKQEQAVRGSMRRAVFYIWGPPGTGKTHTLAALVGALFNAGKRVLICSNTNRAVDQLLVKLCQHLGIEHPALAEGKILRLGRATPELSDKYGDYLLIKSILARLSRDLHERQLSLQAAIAEIEADLSRIVGVLGRFEMRDRASQQEAEAEANAKQKLRIRESAHASLQAATLKHKAAAAALMAWNQASPLRRFVMPSEARLRRRIASEALQAEALAAETRDSSVAADEAKEKVKAWRETVSSLDRELEPHERAALLAQQKSFEMRRTPIREELVKIQAQLGDLERSLVVDAKVIGTTVTKAYLSIKDFAPFDAVIVDEASMVLLPALYVVSGLARERVTISGDFNQLPPIVQTNQHAILDSIGMDVFEASGVRQSCLNDRDDARVVMLDMQRRMVKPICDLVTEAMKYRGLQTHVSTETRRSASPPPAPFDRPLTVIDSSRVWPFETRNMLGSRANLMHTLLVRNLCWHLGNAGFIENKESLGVCTPYAAQAKLTSAILKDEAFGDSVTASTVHRYQGSEKRMMLLDIPESIGSGFNLGQFIQADSLDDPGAKLLNVAISRAQDHLVILANLTYLDAKLPSTAKLRGYLHEMQRLGKVVDAQDVLALRPITEDLRDHTGGPEVGWDLDRSGIFRQDGFDQWFQHDVARAAKSVAIFSGFVTPQRVAAYGDLLRRKVEEGVVVRCVTRPPQHNGSIDPEDTKRALDSLEAIGVVVDTRRVIHEKYVIVDDETVWLGSLNPLSHTSRTDELMHRVVSKGLASTLAGLLAVVPTGAADPSGMAVRRENPRHCDGRMYYNRGKWGPYFKCETCGHNQNVFRR